MVVVLAGFLTLLRPHIPFEGGIARVLTSAAIGALGALTGSLLAMALGLSKPIVKAEDQDN